MSEKQYALIPVPVKEYCSLMEAVYWIAFKAYPVDFEIHAEYREPPTYWVDEKDKPQSLFPAEIYGDTGLEGVSVYTPPPKRSMDPMLAFNQEERTKQIEMTNNLYQKSLAKWKKEHQEHTDQAKAYLKIFLLKEDLTVLHYFSSKDGITEGELVSFNHIHGFIDKLDLEYSSIEVEDSIYPKILIRTTDLLSEFPERKKDTRYIVKKGGVFFLKESDLGNTRGRKEKYNWNGLYSEVSKRLIKGDLPKMSTLIQNIRETQYAKYGFEKDEAPSEGKLKEKLSPIYNVKKALKSIANPEGEK
ncbi:MAG: hypothetical protein ACTSXQ_00220 [Alphaproteobacteria bacterium]